MLRCPVYPRFAACAAGVPLGLSAHWMLRVWGHGCVLGLDALLSSLQKSSCPLFGAVAMIGTPSPYHCVKSDMSPVQLPQWSACITPPHVLLHLQHTCTSGCMHHA
jgi:hypothetical protein